MVLSLEIPFLELPVHNFDVRMQKRSFETCTSSSYTIFLHVQAFSHSAVFYFS